MTELIFWSCVNLNPSDRYRNEIKMCVGLENNRGKADRSFTGKLQVRIPEDLKYRARNVRFANCINKVQLLSGLWGIKSTNFVAVFVL